MLFLDTKHVFTVGAKQEEESLRVQLGNLNQNSLAQTRLTMRQAGQELRNKRNPVPNRRISLESLERTCNSPLLVIQTQEPQDTTEQLSRLGILVQTGGL